MNGFASMNEGRMDKIERSCICCYSSYSTMEYEQELGKYENTKKRKGFCY